MQKPKTAKAFYDAVWFALFGLNDDGALSVIKHLAEDMIVLKAAAPLLWTRADHDRECKEDEARYEKKEKMGERQKERRRISREAIWGLIIQAILAVGTIATVMIMLARMAGRK